MKKNTICVVAWICTGIAVSAGLYLTKDSNCLWAFFIPMFLGSPFKEKEEKEEE